MQGMQLKAAQLPEYGGNSSGRGEAQVKASREAMDEMKVLLNEVLAFEEGFGYTPVVRTAETDADQRYLYRTKPNFWICVSKTMGVNNGR